MSQLQHYQSQQRSYQPLKQTNVTSQQWYETFQETFSEIQIKSIKKRTDSEDQSHVIKFAFKPVYVTERGGKSILMYDSRMMKNGEKYFVMWNDNPLALVKEGDNVIIYEGEIIS